MVPLLTWIGLSTRQGVALSLLYVAFTAASGTFRHLKQRTVDPILGLIVLSGATPMAVVGSHFATILGDRVLQLLFAFLVMGATAAYLVWGRNIVERSESAPRVVSLNQPWYLLVRQARVETETIVFNVNIFFGLAIGVCLGFMSGLLGVGGGWILVPLLILVLGTPLRIAVGTSLLSILPPALVGAMTHWQLGNMDLERSIPLILSGIVGAQLGASLVLRIPQIWLERALVLLLATASTYMLAKGLRIL